MASICLKAISILAGNFNLARSYLITAVSRVWGRSNSYLPALPGELFDGPPMIYILFTSGVSVYRQFSRCRSQLVPMA